MQQHMQQQDWMNEWFYSKIALNIQQQRRQQVVQTEEKKCGAYGCMFCLLISFRQLDLGWIAEERKGIARISFTTNNNWRKSNQGNIYVEMATYSDKSIESSQRVF